MRTFASFIHKEFLHILRDWRTMMIVLLMPVILLMIFGFAISTEVNNIDIMAVVSHHTVDIDQQLRSIDNNSYFTYKGIIPENQIDVALRKGDADAVLVFDAEGNRQLVVDAADANISATATMYLQQALAGNSGIPPIFATTIRHNPQMLSAYNFVPGLMGMLFILICALMTSASIVREKEMGTMEVLLVSPIRPQMIIIAKLIPYFVISCINLLTILLLAYYVLGVPMPTHALLSIILISVLYVTLALSVGLFVSTLVSKQIIALLICAMVMMLPVMMFGGMMFPVDNLPAVLKPLSWIVPARWYIDAMRKLMIEGVEFRLVMKETIILGCMTATLLIVAFAKFRDRL